MAEYVKCDKVYVDKCEYGYGVFAKDDIKEGDVVEKGLMYRLINVDGNENPHLFTWSNDKSVWAGGSGCLPFYNHATTPNIKKIGDLEKNIMTIVALKDIKKGEELRNTYHSHKWRKCFSDLKSK